MGGTCEDVALPTCGDGDCNGVETCSTCPADCGECPAGPISQSDWELLHVSSEELNIDPKLAIASFDSNPETFWHTEWRQTTPSHPHEIQINLGSNYDINGFRYLPRQGDYWENGTVKDYEFYISRDGVNWGSPAANGTFTYSIDKEEKEVLFNSETGRYIRLVALSDIAGKDATSMAELNLLGALALATIPTDINSDNQVDLLDIQACVNVFMEIETDPEIVSRADVNEDETVNVLDIQEVVNAILE